MIPTRASTLRRLTDETFDLLVVGAGATGTAVARDAALRGLRVALVDRGDFAAETSSYSSKLIHGGIRYLEHGHLNLVFEALSERRLLMANAPHLCRPVEFIFPVFRGQTPGLAKLAIGVALYDALALFRPPVKSRRLDPAALHQLAPALRQQDLKGAVGYIDCQTDDSRLVLETGLDAEAAGAAVATYVEIAAPPPARRGHLHVVWARDRAARLNGGEDGSAGPLFPIVARLVVNATGPFSDAFRGSGRALRPTLGVHIVVPAERLPTAGRAFVIRAPQDGRVMFVLPAGTRTLIGTTDTDWPALPQAGAAIDASADDVAYLLTAVAHNFPGAHLGEGDVLSTFAGLRPLLTSDDANPSASSREHSIWLDRHDMLSVAGGKLTTMRRMGEQIVDQAIELLRARGFDAPVAPCQTRTRPLPGAATAEGYAGDGSAAFTLGTHEIGADVYTRLREAYGSRAPGVLAAMAADEDRLARRLVPGLPYLGAELAFAVEHEHAIEVEDVLCRRVPLFRVAPDQGLAAAPLVADLLAARRGLTPETRQASLARYQALVTRSRRWRH